MLQRSKSVPVPASTGRPRDPSRDQAIVRATLELMDQRGFDFSIEEVAERAGVAKTTIYRRFPSKEELMVCAIEAVVPPLPTPDTGSLRGDLIALTRRKMASVETVATPLVGIRLLNDLWRDPKLFALFTERIITPARAPLLTVVDRAVARGELRDDLDHDLILDALFGGLAYRVLISGDLSVTMRDLETFLDVAIEGVGRRERSRP
jgi:AcrR family transcriptional regulator